MIDALLEGYILSGIVSCDLLDLLLEDSLSVSVGLQSHAWSVVAGYKFLIHFVELLLGELDVSIKEALVLAIQVCHDLG